ncbi:MAG: hypothetical protein JO252_02200 [Planctomycetaceae bacterium]|nr:hypothetical protein [Planctomycetaceae bacterium]
MANTYNTPANSPRPQPTFPSPTPGDPRRVHWPEYLLLMADAVERIAGDAECGLFIANHILAMHRQARLMGAVSPADHLAKAQAEADRQAAYVRALEEEAGHWALGPGPDAGDPDLGGWGAHPDDASMQAWIASPVDDTWMN